MTEKEVCIGFDVHSETNVADFLWPDTSQAHPQVEFTQDQKGYAKLRKAIEKILAKNPSVVFHCGIEAAGPYWFPLGYFLKTLQFSLQVTAINPCTIKGYKNMQLKRVKTDPIDARSVAEYMVRFKPGPTDYFTNIHMNLRQIARGRKFFIKQQSSVKNQLRCQLAIVFPEISRRDKKLSETTLAILHRFPSAKDISHASDKQLKEIRYAHSRKRIKYNNAVSLRTLARSSIGVKDTISQLYIKQLIEQIWLLDHQLKESEKQLQDYYMEHFSHTRIHTITGIGVCSAAIVMGEIIDEGRFEKSNNWIGYLGFYPEWQWSARKKQKEFGMTKKGNKYLRHTIYCCTLSAILSNPVIRKHYHNQLSRGKKRMVAVGSCMRKLASIIFGVMKSQKDFNPFYEFSKNTDRAKNNGKESKKGEEETPQSDCIAKVVKATHPVKGSITRSNLPHTQILKK